MGVRHGRTGLRALSRHSRAPGIGSGPPGRRAGTEVLRFVLFRRRGDQRVLPTTSVSRNHRQG
jgi:hypothetical protein